MAQTYDELSRKAARFGQEHLFDHWGTLSSSEKEQLLADVATIDFPLIAELCQSGKEHLSLPDRSRIKPAPVLPANPGPELAETYRKARLEGERLLSESKVAALVVAGGQGTRLGFDAPKGTFPISPVRNKTLFMLFAESIRATCDKYGCRLAWYVMTSDATHEDTVRYFEQSDFLGLSPDDVRFFQQGVMPAVDDAGRIIMADRHRVSLAPNGHGGTLAALADSGALETILDSGVEVISYFQVDNPLVSPADPLFLGLHALHQAQVSSIAVRKVHDLERVGNFVSVDGKIQIIEYSDLPEDLALARDEHGGRLLDAGSVAIHAFCPRFVRELTSRGSNAGLPWHQARKAVPHYDAQRRSIVQPPSPNATKFERFIFDAIPLAERTIVLEQQRRECFSPVKNAEGSDSPETARRDMIARAARWLEDCGVHVPRTESGDPAAAIEISPMRALNAADLPGSVDAGLVIEPGVEVYLDRV